MVNPIPLLRVSTFLPFVQFLEEIGTPTEKLLKESQLPLWALDDLNTLVSRHQVFAFVEKAARQEHILNISTIVGAKTPFISLGAFGRLVCQSLTLYDAISQLIHLSACFNSGERYGLIEQGNHACFYQEYTDLRGLNPNYGSHFSLMLMMDLVKKVAPKTWYPQTIWLQHCHTTQFFDHPLSQAQIHLRSSITGLAFPRYYLSLRLPFSPMFNFQQQQQDYATLQMSAPSLSFSHSLRQAIAPQLREGYPSIQLAADIAQMSVRTLQRRLKEEDITYSQLVSRVRYEIALRLLQDSSLKMIDIAAELGYEDPAHFTRAFKQWTGISPRTFRYQLIKDYAQ